MTPNLQQAPAEVAHTKFKNYIGSSETQAHLLTGYDLIQLFKRKFPDAVPLAQSLQAELRVKQLKLVGEYKNK